MAASRSTTANPQDRWAAVPIISSASSGLRAAGDAATPAAGTRSVASSGGATIASESTGGGSHRSIDGAFNVNPASGTMSLSVPVYTSPARCQFGPTLRLAYSSGNGNGPFGIGWSLPIPSISRCTSTHIPLYDESDSFLHSELEDLTPFLHREKNAEDLKVKEELIDGYLVRSYNQRTVHTVFRIERWTKATEPGEVYWKTIAPDNVTTFYGTNDESRIFEVDSAGRKQIFEWLACRAYDPFGNAVQYIYKSENSEGIEFTGPNTKACEENRPENHRTRARYLKRIMYGNRKPARDISTWAILPDIGQTLFEVVFDYGEHDVEFPTPKEIRAWRSRQDPITSCVSGFEVRSYRLCRRILMFHHMQEKLERNNVLVASSDFAYDENPTASQLISFTACGHRHVTEQSYTSQCLPPYQFEYSKAPNPCSQPLQSMDNSALHETPGGLHNSSRWIDLNGEGTPGSLCEMRPNCWAYQSNENVGDYTDQAAWGPLVVLDTLGGAISQESMFFEDLDHDGFLEAIHVESDGKPHGFHSRSSQSWDDYSTFPDTPNFGLADKGVRRLDVTGSGTGDVIVVGLDSEDIIWYESLGREGFGSEKRVPKPAQLPSLEQPDEGRLVTTADMTGDGLVDIVLIMSGRVAYWPNLGYGRFGHEVTMDASPRFSSSSDFSASRVRLGDVDGSGTSDIIYLCATGGADVYTNQAGNSFSKASHIAQIPCVDDASSVELIDLRGKGTSCLCWTGPTPGAKTLDTLKYIDLAGSAKPNLLKSYKNNMGAETSIEYKPSTWFYVRDKRSGSPWKTQLPFPVQCVYQVTERDEVALSTQTTRYSYHDGYYDRRESEFRGFGFVESWLSIRFSEGTLAAFDTGPSYKRQWFHLGSQTSVLPDECRVLTSEFPAMTLSGEISVLEQAEIFRSLRGLPLREETCDWDDRGGVATVLRSTAYSYSVRTLQYPSIDHFGAFMVSTQETVCNDTGADVSESKIDHQIILSVNDFNDVTQALTIKYGRQLKAQNDSKIEQAQMATSVMLVENIYSNSIDQRQDFHSPVLVSKRNFRLHGFPKPAYGHLYQPRECIKIVREMYPNARIISLGSGASEDFHVPSKALLSEARAYYRDGELSDRLALGEIEPYSILDRTYEKCLMPEDLGALVKDGGVIAGSSLEDLMTVAGYEDLDKDQAWWKPSAKKKFSDVTQDELHHARTCFYQPLISSDPFQNTSVLQLDEYSLVVTKSIDATGNETTYEHDYCRLIPTRILDPNQNSHFQALDCLGLSVGQGVSSKKGDVPGDSERGFQDLLSEEEVLRFFEDPITCTDLLGNMGRRTIFSASSVRQTTKSTVPSPHFEASLTRDFYFGDSEHERKIAISISYLNGRGRRMQTLDLVTQSSDQGSKWRRKDWKLFDGKDNIVREFEDSFCGTSAFTGKPLPEDLARTFFYDSLDRKVGTLNPDHTWSKTVFEPWSTTTYDESSMAMTANPVQDSTVGKHLQRIEAHRYLPSWRDTVRQSAMSSKWDLEAISKSDVFRDNFSQDLLDSDGLVVTTIKRHGSKETVVRNQYDAGGNRKAIFDGLGRLVEKTEYDMLGRQMAKHGMDYGQTTMLQASDGKQILEWDESKTFTQKIYDSLRRLVEVRRSESLLEKPMYLIERYVYGESIEDAHLSNLRLQLCKIYDQSGVRTFDIFDLQGNCIKERRQMNAAYDAEMINWEQEVSLEDEDFETSTVFDALNQQIEQTDAIGNQSRKTYNLQGKIQSLQWRRQASDEWINVISSAKYTADEKEEHIQYGNNSQTTFKYDLASRTLRSKFTSREKATLEDLSFTYDCKCRITHIQNNASQVHFFRNEVIQPGNDYTYDAQGRLVKAVGRENVAFGSAGKKHLSPYGTTIPATRGLPSNDSELCQYVESYTYDDADNILSLRHSATNTAVSGWTRQYNYKEKSHLEPNTYSNRLSSTQIGAVQDSYAYNSDAGSRGCMTSMPGFSELQWNWRQELRSSSSQRVNQGKPETTYYSIDSEGKRTRKVTERASQGDGKPSKLKETIYLPNLNIHRTFAGDGVTVTKEIRSSELNTASKVAMVEMSSLHDNRPLFRYQVGDSLEIDEIARVISYEEYSPFGSTTYRACSSAIEAPSIYRYASYERDAETGFYYCEARYFAPWIGRWISVDPLGTQDNLNVYQYAGNDPVNYRDPKGTTPFRIQGQNHHDDRDEDLTEWQNHINAADGYTEMREPSDEVIAWKKEMMDAVAAKVSSAVSFMESQATTALEYGKTKAETAVNNLKTKSIDTAIDFAFGEEKDWKTIGESTAYAGAKFGLGALVLGGAVEVLPDAPKYILGGAVLSGGDAGSYLLTDILGFQKPALNTLQTPYEMMKKAVRSFGDPEVAAMQAELSYEEKRLEMSFGGTGFSDQVSLSMRSDWY